MHILLRWVRLWVWAVIACGFYSPVWAPVLAPVLANDEEPAIQQAKELTTWLEKHKKDFAQCDTTKSLETYRLCDGTEVPHAELAALFRMSPDALIATLEKKKIKVEILCDTQRKLAPTDDPFKKHCNPKSARKAFMQLTHLHGQYLPEERTILIRSSASTGSLVHEYIHYLQSENDTPVYGKRYKKERNRVQKLLTESMDGKIASIQGLGQKPKAPNASQGITSQFQNFVKTASLMQSFGSWQDLIDERGIFRLYIKYGKDLGISADDQALASKNMQMICKKWAADLPAGQCPP